jgi:hypothetical protein
VASLLTWILTTPKLVTESKSKPIPLGTVGHYCKVQNPSIHTYIRLPKLLSKLYILSSSYSSSIYSKSVETLQRRLFRRDGKALWKMLLKLQIFLRGTPWWYEWLCKRLKIVMNFEKLVLNIFYQSPVFLHHFTLI